MKTSIVQLINNALINAGRSRARRELLNMSERTLNDAGFSRERLLEGNGAWPWRMEPSENAELVAVSSLVEQRSAASTRKERQAIEELRRLSNAELDDLGIARGDIAQVVRHGRTGIDRSRRKTAA